MLHLPGKITVFILLCLAISAIGFIMHMVAVCTPFWLISKQYGEAQSWTGLWKVCSRTTRWTKFTCEDVPEQLTGTTLRAVQGSVLASLLFILVGGVATVAALAMARENLTHTNLLRFSSVVNLFSVISSLAAAVVFWVKTNNFRDSVYVTQKMETTIETGFSLQLEIATAICMFLASIMALIHIRVKDGFQEMMGNNQVIRV